MKENKEVKISYWAAHLTTIVSVALVLLLIGIIALVSIGAARETQRLRERIELSAVMADSVSDARAAEVGRIIAAAPYSSAVKVITSGEALRRWTADTGEDLQALFGVNPLTPEVSFGITAPYASADSIEAVRKRVAAIDGVEAVAAPDAAMVEAMNRNIENAAWLLGAVAIAMLIISFVLINNTVHLSIYSRRFTIHTMQLVGATRGFIRRPFVTGNMLCGVIAGLAAAGVLAAALVCAPSAGIDNAADFISWPVFGMVAAGLVVCGMAICALAASIATTRYLRKDYDELFR